MRTLVILVDYHAHDDTIECLESLVRMKGHFDVAVVDNSGTSALPQKLHLWFENPNIWRKPNTYPWDRVAGHRRELLSLCDSSDFGKRSSSFSNDHISIFLFNADENRGFAAGNNMALRFGLSHEYDYFWILNNDTIVESSSLLHQIQRMSSHGAGMCGSTILYYHERDVVQCYAGATYNRMTAKSSYIGYRNTYSKSVEESKVETNLDMIVGASMMVSRDFLQEVGLMSEEYFLYFEELDWSLRSKDKFSLVYASRSIVYHKHGATTGHNPQKVKRMTKASQYLLQNRLKFTKKYYPSSIISVRVYIFAEALRLLLKGAWEPSIAHLRSALSLGRAV